MPRHALLLPYASLRTFVSHFAATAVAFILPHPSAGSALSLRVASVIAEPLIAATAVSSLALGVVGAGLFCVVRVAEWRGLE